MEGLLIKLFTYLEGFTLSVPGVSMDIILALLSVLLIAYVIPPTLSVVSSSVLVFPYGIPQTWSGVLPFVSITDQCIPSSRVQPSYMVPLYIDY